MINLMNALSNDQKPRTDKMKILKSEIIHGATIQMEEWEECYPENGYAVLWRGKDEEDRYSARSLQDAEEYYEYRCGLAEQGRI